MHQQCFLKVLVISLKNNVFSGLGFLSTPPPPQKKKNVFNLHEIDYFERKSALRPVSLKNLLEGFILKNTVHQHRRGTTSRWSRVCARYARASPPSPIRCGGGAANGKRGSWASRCIAASHPTRAVPEWILRKILYFHRDMIFIAMRKKTLNAWNSFMRRYTQRIHEARDFSGNTSIFSVFDDVWGCSGLPAW